MGRILSFETKSPVVLPNATKLLSPHCILENGPSTHVHVIDPGTKATQLSYPNVSLGHVGSERN